MVGESRRNPLFILTVLMFIVLAIFALFPIMAITIASFKPAQELMRLGLNVKIDVDKLTWANYADIFTGKETRYLIWYKNSLIITFIGTIVTLIFSSMVGYGLAVYKFRMQNVIFILVLVMMIIPLEIIMLPLYKFMIHLKLVNTFTGVILPFAVAPIPVFFFRQYARGLSNEFLDAARVDGCTELGIFSRVMVPLMAPAYAAMAILVALGNWNNFLWPLLMLRTRDMQTIPIGLSTLLTPYGNNYETLISGSVLAIVPVLILFIFFQRNFIEGMTAGGVKG